MNMGDIFRLRLQQPLVEKPTIRVSAWTSHDRPQSAPRMYRTGLLALRLTYKRLGKSSVVL